MRQQPIEPVFGHQHGEITGGVQPADGVDHCIGARRVQLRSWLIEEQQPWLEGEHGGDGHALAFAPGERR